ncbi:hypothetical protein CN520_24460 [Bacillus cereus]|uniref:hypothetical protein n=1 Tax=Bacillus cereus TaxID=1396 RepID=UPI000BF94AEC|nr:hypothetical protein [Bacillus cereus]PET37895.1 hypothetical protein CN520_24460 [Bacillus cereus]PEY79069.1 hypothetical protein CN344_10505 [Bacillus cereus]PFW12850.1 hypothetical protein COL12_03080 [Bacillus cereus]PGP76266.1 hypothetical protein CN999_28105 [Bacillus cereus]
MSYLLWKRLTRRFSFYVALGIGLAISIAQFWTDQFHLKEDLVGIGGISFTPYTKWLGMDNAISDYSSLYMFLLPIVVTLPLADLYAKDRRTGFYRFLIVRGNYRKYFTNLFFLNFITGMFVATFPLIMNIYLSFMRLPNIKPDKIINQEITLMKTTTFFPDLYYTHPFVHMLFYVLLIGIFGGIFASIALSIGMFVKKSFIILLAPFLFQYGLNMIFSMSGHPEMIATNFMLEYSANGVSFTSMIIQLFMGIIISLVLYVIGVKNYVIH